MDFGNKYFVFIETKSGSAEPPYGQRLALERLIDATERGGIPSFLLLAHHDIGEEDVDVGGASVSKYRHRQIWRVPESQITVRQAIDKIRSMFV